MKSADSQPSQDEAQQLEDLARRFTERRNEVRVDCLKKITPEATHERLDALLTEGMEQVHEWEGKLPLVLGGNTIDSLNQTLAEELRDVMLDKFGDDSYLVVEGGHQLVGDRSKEDYFFSDDSETLYGEMSEQHSELWKALWRKKDGNPLIEDHTAKLRMLAFSYSAVGSPQGPIQEVVADKLLGKMKKWLDDATETARSNREWLDAGQPDSEHTETELDRRIKGLIMSDDADVDTLVEGGVDKRLAERRVWTDKSQTTQEEMEASAQAAEEQIEVLNELIPKLSAEIEVLAENIEEVVGSLTNTEGLERAKQATRFG